MLASVLRQCKGASSEHSKRFYSTKPLRTVVGLGKVSPLRPVPTTIPRPPYVLDRRFDYSKMDFLPLLTPENEKKMRASGKLARKVLDLAGSLIRPGITTEEIDAAVHEMIIAHGAYPSPLLYNNFAKSCCTSVNNVACHGVPNDQALFDGDIINVDITVYLDGYHGDCSETFLVGKDHSEEVKRLVKVARQARDEAIALCGPGQPFSVIGNSIAKICREHGYTTSGTLVGHGIGTAFHAQPFIYHTANNEPGVMQPGMTFTIEPLLCQGTDQYIQADDGWTLFSADGKWNAQFEHTILITPSGHDILTL